MFRGRRSIIASVVAALAVGGIVGGAVAGHVTGGVESFTGCLSQNGNLTKFKQGDAPLTPCSSNQVEVHLSGGDITSLLAGTGLTGGAEVGAATLSLAPSYRLPQDCSFGQEPRWNGVGWICGNDGEPTPPGPLP